MTEERSAADLQDAPAVSRSLSATAGGDTSSDPSESDMPTKSPFPEGEPRARKKAATLSPQTRDRIAVQLRSMYDSVASQPVPDRFAELIARLDTADRDP
ncbi:MAG: anti-sigma factor [Parafilimonas terrae]|nr:anti-sigma factor [Parafilimonas terrae]